MIAAGLIDQPLDAQSLFRAVLGAMSEPGTIHSVDRPLAPARPPLCSTTFALSQTLIDGDTPLWLDCDDQTIAQDFRFFCGCPITENPETAAFAILTQNAGPSELAGFAIGTPEYPDRSATLIIQVNALDQGPGYFLKGPGIETSRAIRIDGLPEGFVGFWTTNRRAWPQGVDVILVSETAFLGLPRTVTMEML